MPAPAGAMGAAARRDRGWAWVVLLAAFFCNVAFDGIIFSFGFFYLDFLLHFRRGRGATAWIGSVLSAVYALVGPVASALANAYGCRAVTMGGALFAASGFVLCTFAPNLELVILTYGVMGGIGFGMMYLCSYVMIGHYFEARRALATGIASCGSGVGTFVFAPLSVWLLQTYGWKGSMWVIAGIILNGIVCGATFVPLEIPSDTDMCISAEDEAPGPRRKKLMDWSLLRNAPFMIFCLSSFLCMIGFFVPFIYLPDFAKNIDISREKAAWLVCIIGITNTIARVACGWVSDKPWADALKLYNGALIVGGTLTMGVTWIHNFYLLCVYAAIFGVCVAAYVSLCAIILVEFLGLERLSNSFGFLNMFRGIAAFIGVPLAGVLFDVTGRYELAFIVAGATICAAGVICLPLRGFRRCAGAREAMKQHGYDKERALTLTSAELQELRAAAVAPPHRSVVSLAPAGGSAMYFASLHSIHSFKGN